MIKTNLDTRMIAKFYPGICIGIKSDVTDEDMEKEGHRICIRMQKHVMLLPFIEFGMASISLHADSEEAMMLALKDIENEE